VKKNIRKRYALLAVWLISGFAVATQYNACGNVEFSASSASQLVDFKSAAIILINKDAPYTSSDLVEVNLEAPLADEVYVTNDSTCASGGSWEPLIATRAWTLAAKNQNTKVYAQFRNTSEQLSTDCLTDDILHDDIAPSVVLQQPVVITKIETPVVEFVAGDQGSGLDKMFCQWPSMGFVECQFATSIGKLNEGRYFVNIKASDKAGNVSVPVVQDLMVDRTPPVITFLAAPASSSNISSPSVSFNAVDALSGVKTLECAFDNKANYAPCTSPKSAMNQPEGNHKFFVRATDFAGNASEAEHSYNIDLSAPTVTITKYPPDYSNTNSGTFEFEGKDGIEPITSFECKLDSGAYMACSSPKTYTNLSEGVHKFEVVGIDKVGNKSAAASRSWYVDTTAPVITFQLKPDPVSNNPNPSFKYSITDSGSGVDSQECSLDGGAYAACSKDSMAYMGLAEGSHNFRVRAKDKAGNQGLSELVTFVIDLSPPAVQLTVVPPKFSNQASFNFGFNATDSGSGIARVECRVDAGAYMNCNSLSAHLVNGLAEGGHRFTAKATDKAGNVSPEVSYDWIVDLTGPAIAYYQLPPASALATTVISLGFTVSDALSGVKSVSCKLNNAATACKSGELKTFVDLPAGTYAFEVTAEDNAGNISKDTKSFSLSAPVLKNQVVDVKGNAKVDILVVIDNSGSMATEQANMAARFSNFLDQIKALDYQIGIISTDTGHNINAKLTVDTAATGATQDGRLLQLKNMPGQYIVNSSMLQATAQTLFGNTVQMGSNGSGYERGFKATLRAIDRAFSNAAADAANKALFRADAGLAVVVVSDAYDDSGFRPEDVTAKIVEKWGGNKSFVFHSIVVPESVYTTPNSSTLNNADPCKNYRESAKFDGREYHRLSTMTGGVKGTVCSENYTAQLSDMGKVTADLVNSITLSCQPIDYNKDGNIDGGDVQVTGPSGAPITGFTVMGNKLNFGTVYLPVGANSVSYYCAQ
jgi:hypothetical protein